MVGFVEGSWIVDRGSWMKEEASPEPWKISLKFLMRAFILPWMLSIMIHHSKNRERISH
jgi:hypothetical protein